MPGLLPFTILAASDARLGHALVEGELIAKSDCVAVALSRRNCRMSWNKVLNAEADRENWCAAK
jgi:hypothetical protein